MNPQVIHVTVASKI